MGIVQSIWIVKSLGRKDLALPISTISFLLMKRGSLQNRIVSLAMERLIKELAVCRHKTPEEFRYSMLIFFGTVNSALPGRHFEQPTHGKVQELYEYWKKESSAEAKKEKFIEWLVEKTDPRMVDGFTLMAGLAAPSLSMVAKRAVEKKRRFRMVKNAPDFLFVPSVTVLALFSAKLIRNAIRKHADEVDEKGKNADEVDDEKRKKASVVS